ncbi:hypothetical protein ACJMK2_036268 [Sinanodonta woodiana]|uniref:Triokinase/FMN cyclase n=1 Tax=Sinanodonta woodiana TaxID=1069815 RepID=A0ABD3WK58_SINWO
MNHYMQACYVGQGMLSAAVAGSIFTSPPPQSILTGIRTIAKGNQGGCLVAVANYTGDRLNFGLAMERAKQEGIHLDSVTVGEDCAMASQDKTAGRRGLAGAILLFKIAGALAEEGRSLEEITQCAKDVASSMGTIGLALGPCSVPGTGPLFHIQEDEIELGLGVHGEAGVKRMKILTAKETVKLMIDHMINPANSTHLKLKSGDKVACMINNLGGLSVLEMNIVANEAITYLEEKEVLVDRAYCGSYITSLEMPGVSITLLHLTDTIKRCLDAPTNAPAWLTPYLPAGQTDRKTSTPIDPLYQPKQEEIESSAAVSPDEASHIYSILQNVCEQLVASEGHLNGLDSESGDGDCGSTIARGAQNIKKELLQKDSKGWPFNHPQGLSLAIGRIAENCMGGCSGGLYSLFFTSAAQAFQEEVSSQTFAKAMYQGIKAIQRYGGAEPGDRTMLDALHAAYTTFSSHLAQLSPPKDAFAAAVQAAEKGAEATTWMKAKAGRASYVSADLLTKPDPGATAVAIWLRAVLEKL